MGINDLMSGNELNTATVLKDIDEIKEIVKTNEKYPREKERLKRLISNQLELLSPAALKLQKIWNEEIMEVEFLGDRRVNEEVIKENQTNVATILDCIIKIREASNLSEVSANADLLREAAYNIKGF